MYSLLCELRLCTGCDIQDRHLLLNTFYFPFANLFNIIVSPTTYLKFLNLNEKGPAANSNNQSAWGISRFVYSRAIRDKMIMMEVVWVISDNDPGVSPHLWLGSWEVRSPRSHLSPLIWWRPRYSSSTQQINKLSLKISNNPRISFCQIVFLDDLEIWVFPTKR